jgi:hypothetical protein
MKVANANLSSFENFDSYLVLTRNSISLLEHATTFYIITCSRNLLVLVKHFLQCKMSDILNQRMH